MPSRSKKQARFMTIAAHDAEFAKRNHISQEVAKEFHDADKQIEEAQKQSGKDKENKRAKK